MQAVDSLQQIKGNLERLRSALSSFAGLMDPSRVSDDKLVISRLVQDIARSFSNVKRQPDTNRTQLGVLEGQFNDMQASFRQLCEKKKNFNEDPEARRLRVIQEEEDRKLREEEARKKREDEVARRQRQAQIDFTVSMVEDRTHQIRSLHEEVAAVNTATRDLAAMVAEDTERLELLSMTAQRVEENVAEGNRQVSQANELQKSSRTKLCCILLLVLLLCGILVFIFVYFRCAIFGGC